jgi:hypothetical protein
MAVESHGVFQELAEGPVGQWLLCSMLFLRPGG